MALEMCRLLHHDFSINEMHLELRIGIGTGPVVAGVVGKKKFIYDLWGDTVNIASRVTTEGFPASSRSISEPTGACSDRFDFQEPQTIYLKGKGNMVVHRLIGRRRHSRQPLDCGRRARRRPASSKHTWPATLLASRSS
jgi:adenylate cyclase